MSQPSEALVAHQVRVDSDTLRLTLPTSPWVFRFWVFVIASNVAVPAIVWSLPNFPLAFFDLTPVAWVLGAYFAVRAWKNKTVFAFDAEAFSAVYGPWPPERTRFAMPIASIVSFDAEYGEQHEMGFVIKVLNLHGERIHVPARLLGVVTTLRGSSRYLSGKPSNALVLALAKELNNLLAESRERQRSFRS